MLAPAAPAWAIITHPSGDDSSTLDHPPSGYVGSWAANGSTVPIAPNYVITTRHQFVSPTSPNPSIVINGQVYHFVEIVSHPTADLRVARITLQDDVTPANLTSYASLYDPDVDGTEVGKTMVMGGFGRARGSDLTSGATTWGYAWDSSPNTTLRWGANRIDQVSSNFNASGFISETLVDDFDSATAGTSVPFEAALATNDSGGGWFIKNSSGQWKVAGLNAYTSHAGYSQFRNDPATPGTEPPDTNWAIRVSSYSSFIYSAFAGLYLKGDMNGDGSLNNLDIQPFEVALTKPSDYLADHPTLTNYEERGDITGDGFFNNLDIQPFERLLTGTPPAAEVVSAAVPEPSSLALTISGLTGAGFWWWRARARKPGRANEGRDVSRSRF